MRCPNCKSTSPAGAVECDICGHKLAKRATVAEPARVQGRALPSAPSRKRATVAEVMEVQSSAPAEDDVFGRHMPERPTLDPHDEDVFDPPAVEPPPAPEPSRKRPTIIQPAQGGGVAVPAGGRLWGALFEFRDAADTGRIHGLERGRNTLGRGDDCDLVLDDGQVSRNHGMLYVDARGCRFIDTSQNGTLVDGRTVVGEQVEVEHGSVITMGESRFVLVVLPEASRDPWSRT